MLSVVVAQLAVLATGYGPLKVLSALLVLAIPLLGWRAARTREIYLGGLSLILLVLVLLLSNARAELLVRALSQSAFLAAFFLLVGTLREGALNAPSVLTLGNYLTKQPPSRRFLSVFAGGHYFAILTNLGALSLMTPIIQSGVRANLAPGEPLDEVSAIRERRQLTALLRGFSWILLWAPTAVTQAVLPTLMGGIQPLRLISLGLLLVAIMTVVSWAEDWARWRRYSARRAKMGVPRAPVEKQIPWRAVSTLLLVSAALFGLGLCFIATLGSSIIGGVLMAVIPVVTVWLWAQSQNAAAFRARVREIAFVRLPGYIREVLFISAAGFIGTTAGALLPADKVATALQFAHLPPWLLLMSVSLLFLLAGQVGFSPITVTVFLGAIFGEFARQGTVLPVEPTYIALAIAAGSACSTVGGPFSAGAVLLAKATGYPATTLTWKWNGLFVGLVLLVLAIFYIVLTR